MADDTPPLPPRGWYPDPAGSAAWRWWDGGRWTDDLHAYQARERVAAATLADEQAATGRLTAVGIPLLIAVSVINAALRVADASYWRATVQWFRANLDQVGTPGFVASKPPTQPMLSSLMVLPELVISVVLIVLLLTAQHKMATVARELGLRARLTPTWGVVVWFIPVVDLVLPLLAWQDMVPAGHPLRRQIVAAWLAYVGAGIVGVLSIPASLVSVGLVAATSALSLGLLLVVARILPSLVAGIVAHHEAAGGPAGQGGASAL